MNNQLILGDSLEVLIKWYLEGKREFIDLVYNDPPFNSNRNYNILFNPKTHISEEAFEDIWSTVKYIDLLEDFKDNDIDFYNFMKEIYLPTDSLKAYCTIMGITYWYIHKMIKDTGSMWHHCDQRTSHYMKVILDYIFSYHRFQNEVFWVRTTNTGSSKSIANAYPKNHDSILYYTKSKRFIFNQQIRQFEAEELEWRFPLNDNDDKGPYHWNTLVSYSQERLEYLRRNNELRVSTKEGVKHPNSYKVYLKQHKGGIVISDLWNDIKPIHGSYQGYATQKPQELLERIINTSTNPDDLVVDFFNGGGTTVAACIKLQRNFIGIDINYRAIQITKERLDSLELITKEDYYILGIPKSSKELRELVNQNLYGKQKNSKFALEEITIKWYLNDVKGNKIQVADNSIDGRFTFPYEGKIEIGLVQVTSSATIGHFKQFCSEIGLGTGLIGVYISFEDTITKGIRKKAKQYGRVDVVDKIQILTFEDLIDKGLQFKIPEDVLTS